MPIRSKKSHPALNHAGYSATSVLPGENVAEFDQLHRDLIAELTPAGPLEDDIVADMARLLWRKQNLATFRVAEIARRRLSAILSEMPPHVAEIPSLGCLSEIDPAALKAAIHAADDQARAELGDVYELARADQAATTINGLIGELEVQDRLNSLIDRCLKRLLYVRGLKSISSGSSATSPKRIPGPKAA
jgi:hypothetical protein